MRLQQQFLLLFLLALSGLVLGFDSPQPVPVEPVVVFERALEPREQAFLYLKPVGWIARGGIIRRDPLALGPRDDTVAPQLDFSVQRDSAGSALIAWLPNTVYCDVSRSPVADANLFPPGSQFQGMLVYPRMTAHEFLLKMMVSGRHPRAADFEFIEQRRLPELAAQYRARVRALPIRATHSYDAATLTLKYEEDGVIYIERWLTVIEDRGEMGGGQWGNKETLVFRAPADEFVRLEPVFSVIQGSLSTDPAWVAREVRVRAEEGEISLATRDDIVRVDSQITDHRRLTNAEIHAQVFLMLADQQEFLNPFSGAQEVGSNRWPYRWMDSTGTVVYSSYADYDPNQDSTLAGRRFRRCETIVQTDGGAFIR